MDCERRAHDESRAARMAMKIERTIPPEPWIAPWNVCCVSAPQLPISDKTKCRSKELFNLRKHRPEPYPGHAERDATRCFARRLSDADARGDASAAPGERVSGWERECARCSMSQRASMAQLFSSTHWSRSLAISFRRLAA